MSCTSKPQGQSKLVLSDYPELFGRDAMIIVGENASQIELGSVQAIAAKLEELTGIEPIISKDNEVSEEDRENYNLVLVGTPNSNNLLQEVFDVTNATRVTKEYPGGGKGILEILRNPWNEDKAILLVEGSDECGVNAGELMMKDRRSEEKTKIFVDWKKYTGVGFPIDSEEEAVRYAKTDHDVEEFIKKWIYVKTWAHFLGPSNNLDNNFWAVGFEATSVKDKWFEIHFKPDGTIITKGEGSI